MSDTDRTRDAYDAAIEYLTANPGKIHDAWTAPVGRSRSKVARAHCLFSYVTKSRRQESVPTGLCGCITQIRSAKIFVGCRDDLTKAIRSDSRLPSDPERIYIKHLPFFAAWQRKLDAELGRTPPEAP